MFSIYQLLKTNNGKLTTCSEISWIRDSLYKEYETERNLIPRGKLCVFPDSKRLKSEKLSLNPMQKQKRETTMYSYHFFFLY